MNIVINSHSDLKELKLSDSFNSQRIFISQENDRIEIDMAMAAELAVTLIKHVQEQAVKYL